MPAFVLSVVVSASLKTSIFCVMYMFSTFHVELMIQFPVFVFALFESVVSSS